ncbi:hypothetical protein CCACVL1_07571 [Corchorus capsularis]|uniref:Uncharacterized protein n=1 Tax=Corchorus capsularis TaxID=210143 RepID=A0A1R3J507_COCAP|nr:hypothetical protein CCACVL1_07571 [Corchorus capsularis]
MSSSGTPEISLGSLNRVNLEGSNAGATMLIRRGMAGEAEAEIGGACVDAADESAGGYGPGNGTDMGTKIIS